MTCRIRDPRVQNAFDRGEVDGLTTELVDQLAALADFLTACRIWSDVTLAFDSPPAEAGPGRWRVSLSDGWWLSFGWMRGLGPVELELLHEPDG